MIRLFTLGAISIESDEIGDACGSLLAAPKRLALLTFLATARPHGFHQRDRILALFWPDSSQDKARRVLNQTVYLLRQEVGSGTIVGRGDTELGIAPDRLWCDARVLETAAETDDARVAELYRGPFLDGFHLNGSREFSRWLEQERDRLERRALKAILRLAGVAAADGRGDDALELLRRAGAQAPLDEELHRRLLTALEGEGRIAEAIRAQQVFDARLREDLGAAASPATMEVVERLQRHSKRKAPAGDSTAPSEDPRAMEGVERVETSGSASSRDRPRELRRRRLWIPVVTGIAVVLGLLAVASRWGPFVDDPDLVQDRVLFAGVYAPGEDPRVELLTRLASDWLIQDLATARLGELVVRTLPSSEGDGSEPREGPDPAALTDLARQHRARYVAWGNVRTVGEELHWRGFVADARTQTILGTTEPIESPVDEAEGAIPELQTRLTGLVATVLDHRLEDWVRHSSPPPSLEAYAAFSEGLSLFTLDRNYAEAWKRFRDAADVSTTRFPLAEVWTIYAFRRASTAGAAMVEEEAEWYEPMLARLTEDRARSRLAPLDAAFFDYVHWGFAAQDARSRDRSRSIAGLDRVIELAPLSEYLVLRGSEALQGNDPRRALEVFLAVDRDARWFREWATYWPLLAQVYHQLDDLEEALAAATEGRKRHPQTIFPIYEQARALAALGRTEELQEAVEASYGMEAESYILHPGGMMFTAAQELLTHGHSGHDYWMERALAWLRDEANRAENPTIAVWQETFEILALVELDRADEARPLAESFRDHYAAYPYTALWPLALVAAAQGAEDADELERELSAFPGPGALVRLAMIAGIRGDRDLVMERLWAAVAAGHRRYEVAHSWEWYFHMQDDPRYQRMAKVP